MNILKPLLLLTLAVAAVLPASAYTVWSDGQGLTYHLFSNGEAELSSVKSSLEEVTIPASIIVDGVSYSVTELGTCNMYNVKKLVIEAPITEISNNRFYKYTNLKSVVLPETLTTIEDYAFYQSGLEEIKFPQSLTTIGNYAFSQNQLKYIHVPENVMSLGYEVFSGNPLEMVSYNAGSGAIEPDLFKQCYNLRMLIIGDKIKRVGKGTDKGSLQGSGWIWNNFIECEEAFIDSPLTDVYIDNTVPPTWYIKFESFYGSVQFTKNDKQTVLHIPASAIDAYKSASIDLGVYTQTVPPYRCYNIQIKPYDTDIIYARFKQIDEVEGGFISPETITITGSHEVVVTQSVQLTAGFLPENINIRNIIWHSSNPDVATVNHNGLVKGVALGDVEIYAESPVSGAKSEIFPITVKAVPPTDFTLDLYANPLVMGIGGSYTLNPVYTPDGCSVGMTYESSDPDIATVDADGTVKAIRRGNCEIKGAAKYGGLTRELKVTVVPKASEIKIIPLDPTPIAGGEPVQMKAEILPAASAGQTVIWSVRSDTGSFTLTPDGILTPLKEGGWYVKVRTPDGCEDEIFVSIDYAPVEEIRVPESVTIDHLEILDLGVTVIPDLANPFYNITSDNTDVVGVKEYSDEIIGLTAGEATVTVTHKSGAVSASTKVTVNPADYTINLSANRIEFDSELKPLTEGIEAVNVCPVAGILGNNSYGSSQISSNVTTGYKLYLAGTDPEDVALKLVESGSFLSKKGYSGCLSHYTFCDVSPYWSISDDKVAQLLPILDQWEDYYMGLSYYPYAMNVAILPKGQGKATITYNPDDSSGITATCEIVVGQEAGVEIVDSEAGLTVTTDGNRILAVNPDRKEIAVYNTAGTLVARGDSQQFATPVLPSGIYIVTTADSTTKVAL